MIADEYQAPSINCSDPSLAVEITDATFIWDPPESTDQDKKKKQKKGNRAKIKKNNQFPYAVVNKDINEIF